MIYTLVLLTLLLVLNYFNPNFYKIINGILYKSKVLTLTGEVAEIKQKVEIDFQVLRNKISGKCWHRSLNMHMRLTGHQRWSSTPKSKMLWEEKLDNLKPRIL